MSSVALVPRPCERAIELCDLSSHVVSLATEPGWRGHSPSTGDSCRGGHKELPRRHRSVIMTSLYASLSLSPPPPPPANHPPQSPTSLSATGINVPRSRFLPVKKTSDLLVVMSNLFTMAYGTLRMNPARTYPSLPVVKLGDQHFMKVPAAPENCFITHWHLTLTPPSPHLNPPPPSPHLNPPHHLTLTPPPPSLLVLIPGS